MGGLKMQGFTVFSMNDYLPYATTIPLGKVAVMGHEYSD